MPRCCTILPSPRQLHGDGHGFGVPILFGVTECQPACVAHFVNYTVAVRSSYRGSSAYLDGSTPYKSAPKAAGFFRVFWESSNIRVVISVVRNLHRRWPNQPPASFLIREESIRITRGGGCAALAEFGITSRKPHKSRASPHSRFASPSSCSEGIPVMGSFETSQALIHVRRSRSLLLPRGIVLRCKRLPWSASYPELECGTQVGALPDVTHQECSRQISGEIPQ